jgi:hypothetical protein
LLAAAPNLACLMRTKNDTLILADETSACLLLCPAVGPRAGSGMAEELAGRGPQNYRRGH